MSFNNIVLRQTRKCCADASGVGRCFGTMATCSIAPWHGGISCSGLLHRINTHSYTHECCTTLFLVVEGENLSEARLGLTRISA